MGPEKFSLVGIIACALFFSGVKSGGVVAPDPCVVPTSGGNGGGANCVFPFTVGGTEYNNCIESTIESKEATWCATTADYATDMMYGLCEIIVTRVSDNTDQPCVFPFTYLGQTYTDCTVTSTMPWCATVADLGETFDWGYCDIQPCNMMTTPTTAAPETTTVECTTPTLEGTGTDGGANCVFPFSYNGVTYTECTMVAHTTLWCATVANYNNEGRLWGDCGDEVCGATTVDPYTTPSTADPFATPSTTVETTTAETTTAAETTTMEMTTPTTAAGACYERVATEGGVPEGQSEDCSFPYIYNGVSYNECITTNYNKPWCGTTPDYDTDQLWGDCVISTVDGDRCSFPFSYNGQEYYECTDEIAASGGPSCGLVYDVGTSADNWGNCNLEPETVCPSTDSTVESTTEETTTGASMTTATTPGLGPRPCTPTYNMIPDQHGLEGAMVAATSVDACEVLCNADVACAAYDFDTITSECFTHQAGYVSQPSPGVNMYVKMPCEEVTTAAGGECVDTFEVMEDILSFDGDEVLTAKSVEMCQAACLEDDTCLAFDFDTITFQCFKHIDGYLDRLNPAGVDVDQYRRVPCAEETTAAATPGPASPSTTPGVTPPATTGQAEVTSEGTCVDTFEMFMDTNALLGVDLVGTTVEECQQSCIDDPTCVAFDFDLEQSACYMHVDGFMVNLNTMATGVNQYRRIFCVPETEVTTPETTMTTPTLPTSTIAVQVCQDTFEEFVNTLSHYGEDTTIASVEECKIYCLQNPLCAAFDFDTNKVLCFIHVEGYQNSIATEVMNVNQYRRVRCPSLTPTPPIDGCVDTFSMVANRLSYDGEPQDIAVSVEDCTVLCLEDDTCVGFDFNTIIFGCYLHTEVTFPDYIDMGDAMGVDQYTREYCESATDLTPTTAESSTTSTTTESTTTTTTGSTISSTTPTTTLPGTCTDTFTMVTNMNWFDGGDPVVGPTSAETCQASCLLVSFEECRAFDWDNLKSECYFHNAVHQQADSNGVDHYDRVQCNV